MSQKLKETKHKAGRRGNNEGSIYLRKDGRWCGSVTIGYKSDGKPIRKDFYGKTRQEVARKITALAGEVFDNGYVNVSASKERNFQMLMQQWFDLFVAPKVASTTRENRQNMLKHFFKAFGTLDVQDVSLEALQRFFNGKVRAGTAADSINKMKNMLIKFFSYAVKKAISAQIQWMVLKLQSVLTAIVMIARPMHYEKKSENRFLLGSTMRFY